MDRNNSRNQRNNSYFKDFYREDKIKTKLEKKECFKGTLINESNKWYVKTNNNEKIYVDTERDRNRAFNNDSVVVEVDSKNKKKGSIVFIYNPLYKKQTFEGKVVNEIRNENRKSNNSLFFIPNDRNVPYFEIKFDGIDRNVLSIKDFRKEYDTFRGRKYLAKIDDWNPRFKNPLGILLKEISNNSNNSNNSNKSSLTVTITKDNHNRTVRRVESNSNFNENRKSLRNSRSSNFNNSDLRHSKSNPKFKEPNNYYESYYNKESVTEGLNNKSLLKGKLNIQDWKKNDSFVIVDGTEDKVYIKSDVNRNRGLDNDDVVIKLLNSNNENKTGKVVYIEKPSYKNMEIYGKILFEFEKRENSERRYIIYLCPKEKKLPKIEIPKNQIPRSILNLTDLFKNQNKYKQMNNFVCKISKWDDDDIIPIGSLIRNENSNEKELNASDIHNIIEDVKKSGTNKPFEALKIKLKAGNKDPSSYFNEYYPKELVDYGLTTKNLFKGKVEILTNKNSDCFVNLNDTNEKITIGDRKDRNRSMHGDNVIVEITDESSSPKKGKIVYIEDPIYFKDMKIQGTIRYNNETKSNNIIFCPDDKRIPLIDIPISKIDKNILDVNDFIKNQEEYKDIYYNAKIIKYGSHRYSPLGELIEKLDIVKKNNDYYEKYLSEKEVEEGLANKTLYEGLIRVSNKSGSDSYVTVVGLDQDIRINSVKFRNRALDNDIVIVKLLEGEELQTAEAAVQQKKEENRMKDEDMFNRFFTKGVKINDYIPEKTNPLGKIVYVRRDPKAFEQIDIVGKFKFDPDRDYTNEERFIFCPSEKNIPLMDILVKDIDPEIFDIKDFINNHEKYEDTLIVARIIRWSEMKCYPLGKIVSKLTDEHTIESRTKIILKTHNIDDNAFYDLITNEIPSDDWKIPEEEYKERLDLREECIFTIDPLTARDLDDALSCKKLDDGTYEVGIHIADVSYFVRPKTNMDKEAYKRGTSTYLVQRVIPMLPRTLCENLCSLNPSEDRLAFSVIIKMDKDGNVLDAKASKSIICSCVKLAYEHAQSVIDNNGEWPEENKDIQISNPHHNYTSTDVRDRINDLYRLSRRLKEERYRNGAVSLNRKKLWFQINQEDESPLDFGIYESREANSLVEEFMLLANMTVATMLHDKYTNEALLRNHEPPKEDSIRKNLALISFTNKLIIDVSSSKAFHDSLIAVRDAGSIYSDVALSKCIKFMKRANYICSTGNMSDLFHYGLHIPLYTHFTSPIRRYPDIIVHRQLQALLHDQPSPYNANEVNKIAKRSNDTKANAKKAQDENSNLYLIYLLSDYLKKNNKEFIIEDALVIGFDNYSIEITLPRFAFEDKISINHLYEKDILKGVVVRKPLNPEDDKEVEFDVYWNDGISMDNILEKYNAETPEAGDLQQQQPPPQPQPSDKPINLEDVIKNNTTVDRFDSVDDGEFSSEEALAEAVAEAEAAALNGYDNDITEEEAMEKKKEELSKYRKQTFKIFDEFKIIMIPNFDKMKMNILLAPPDVDQHTNADDSYHSHSAGVHLDTIFVSEPEGGYD